MEKTIIYPLNDLHLGNKYFDKKKLINWLNDFEKCKDNKIIYSLGDMLDASVIFNGEIEKTLEKYNKIINKLKPYIRYSVKGNNDYFIEKRYKPIFNNSNYDFYDTLNINNIKYKIYGRHGNDFIFKSEIKNKLNQFNKKCDIYLQGHYHYSYYTKIDNRYYVFNSCFLKNTDDLLKIEIAEDVKIKKI